MAVIGANNPTLMDVMSVREPGGGITTDLVELLKQDNQMLDDMTWMEANDATAHRVSIRVGMPSPTWRQFYQGVMPSKNVYDTVSETMGMMEARAQIDQKLADLESNRDQYRLNEAIGFLEGMNQEMQATVIYGNIAAAATKFNGLAPRYADNTTAASKENVIDAGGSGSDNTSIYLVGWSPRSVFGIYPKGSMAGLQRIDLGLNHHARPPDGSSGEFSAYEEKFTWDAGLVVKDWRYVVRIANIDVSNLVAESSAANILKLMTKAVHKVPSLGAARFAFYANRTVETMLDIQAQAQTNVYLNVGQEEGMPKVSFRGIPIRRVDQILLTEAQVT